MATSASKQDRQIEKQVRTAFAGIVSPSPNSRRKKRPTTGGDHSLRLTERRVSRLVRGEQKRQERNKTTRAKPKSSAKKRTSKRR